MTKSYYIVLKTVFGQFAYWAVRQSPYSCPEHLQEAIHALNVMAFPYFHDGTRDTRMWRCTEATFQSFMEGIKEIPEVQAWGHPKLDTGATMIVISRYGGPPPDEDCIDLDALIRNITTSIFDEAKRDDETSQRISSE